MKNKHGRVNNFIKKMRIYKLNNLRHLYYSNVLQKYIPVYLNEFYNETESKMLGIQLIHSKFLNHV